MCNIHCSMSPGFYLPPHFPTSFHPRQAADSNSMGLSQQITIFLISNTNFRSNIKDKLKLKRFFLRPKLEFLLFSPVCFGSMVPACVQIAALPLFYCRSLSDRKHCPGIRTFFETINCWRCRWRCRPSGRGGCSPRCCCCCSHCGCCRTRNV